MSGSGLSLRDVRVRLGNEAVLENVSLAVPAGSTLALLGPSGCGKTTLLRVVAGLQAHDGEVVWEGQAMNTTAAHRRGFGLLFQDHALFPHLDVAGNVAYGLRIGRRHRAGRLAAERTVDRMLALVGMQGRARRPIDTLSGGEARRVSLARALAPHPRLLMLDEPLSGLDRPLREQLLADIRELLTSLGQTALYVTHDLQEALAVADRVAVMRAGRIEQVAEAAAIYRAPATEFVARFLGLSNIFELIPTATSGLFRTPLGEVRVRGATGVSRALLHPARLSLQLASTPHGVMGPGSENRLTATVATITPYGPFVSVTIRLGGAEDAEITALVSPEMALPLEVGAQVQGTWDDDAWVMLRE